MRCWYGKTCESLGDVSTRRHGHGASRCQHPGVVWTVCLRVSVFILLIQITVEELAAPRTHCHKADSPREFAATPGETRELEREFLAILDLPIERAALAGAAHALRSFDTARRDTLAEKARHSAMTRPRRRLSVLVAEDNPVNRKVTARILERAGHHCRLVEDGDQALDALELGRFDIVLMDVNMPGASGLDVVKIYRAAHLADAHLPIVALTADATMETRRQCEEAGMDAYVAKPLRPTELIAVMSRLLRGADAPAPPENGKSRRQPVSDTELGRATSSTRITSASVP